MFFSELEMLFRLVIAIFIGGLVGYEREMRGRDAGIRTHAIVSLGAAVMALVQLKTSNWLLEYTIQNPEYSAILTSDITRFIAQIVSGIGFLGAGTIIVSKRSVTGLTTAASIWAVAGLGISVGMGYYSLGLFGTILILVVLRIIKTLFQIGHDKNIEVHYEDGKDTNEFIEDILKKNKIKIISEDYSVYYMDKEESIRKVRAVYELRIPKQLKLKKLIDLISHNKNILKVSTIKWN